MCFKVLFTASTFSHIRNFHLPYLKAFQDAGSIVHVACGGRIGDFSEADRIITVPFKKTIRSFSNIQSIYQLHRLMKEEHYDLVITHTSLAAFFTRLAICLLPKKPVTIYMCHGYLFDNNSGFVRKTALLAAERLVAKQTDLLLNMNQYDYKLAAKYHLGQKIALIPGVGVDYDHLDQSRETNREILRRRFGIPQDAFVLLYAAEFSKRKNQEFLIRAMSSLPEKIFLVLAGAGDLLGSCKDLSAQLGLSGRILFPGHVSNISDWYAMANAAVSSSRSEGLPFNIMEAMHFGLPIVASDVKGNSDLICNGESGILFPLQNDQEYTAAILALYSSGDMCSYLGFNARSASEAYALRNVFPIVWGYYWNHR